MAQTCNPPDPTMATASSEFARYCCELLESVGHCTARRMFGGWGISTDGLTLAIIADLGSGEKLWLKADDATRAQWLSAGCERFTYESTRNGVAVTAGMNYYSAPEDAMDSCDAMRPWARLALQAALSSKAGKAGQPKPARKPKAGDTQ
jgi:DNA transformation protein